MQIKKASCVLAFMLLFLSSFGCSNNKVELQGFYLLQSAGSIDKEVEIDVEDTFEYCGYQQTIEIMNDGKVILDEVGIITETELNQVDGKYVISIPGGKSDYTLEKTDDGLKVTTNSTYYNYTKIDKNSYDRYKYRDAYEFDELVVRPIKSRFQKIDFDGNDFDLILASDEISVIFEEMDSPSAKDENYYQGRRNVVFEEFGTILNTNDFEYSKKSETVNGSYEFNLHAVHFGKNHDYLIIIFNNKSTRDNPIEWTKERIEDEAIDILESITFKE